MLRSTLRALLVSVLLVAGCSGSGGGGGDGEENRAPAFTSAGSAQATEDVSFSFTVTTTDPDVGDTRSIRATSIPGWLALEDHGDGTAAITGLPRNEHVGSAQVVLEVKDRAGAPAGQVLAVAVANVNDPPTLGGTPPLAVEEGSAYAFTPTAADVDAGDVLTFSAVGLPAWLLLDAGTGELAGVPGAADVGAAGPVTLTVADLAGASASLPAFTIAVTAAEPIVPPDPATLATPLDTTVPTEFGPSVAFLYTGPDPIQKGVAEGTIAEQRAAVLRGRVLDHQGGPLAGVRITVLGHTELGRTHTRLDGRFDLVVNGGGELTVNYAAAGFLPAQRKVNAPWRDFAVLPDVSLVPLDPAVTVVDLASAAPFQVARGSPVSDDDGARRATVLFPAGTAAELVVPGGTVPLPSLSVRATEYTVGARGPERMPAELPPTTRYTYALELSADEALVAGAAEVRFDRPVPFYLEDFLGFPVGSGVPTAYYDRLLGQWVPQPNGRVVKVLALSGGAAEVDTDGDGAADDGAALGMTAAERVQLASLYPAGQRLWRVPIEHFSPWDCNWPGTFVPPDPPPPGPPDPPPPDGPGHRPHDEDCCKPGSVIECANQLLGEDLPVAGTPFTLHHGSERVGGWRPFEFDIPLTGSTIDPALHLVQLEVRLHGQLWTYDYPPSPNLVHHFNEATGVDPYGRPVNGPARVIVTVRYWYPWGYFVVDGQYYNSFGMVPPGSVPSFVPVRGIEWGPKEWVWTGWVTQLRAPPGADLGGWSLSPHHVYLPEAKVLYKGDGGREGAAPYRVQPVIELLPGQTHPSLPNFRMLGSPTLRGLVRPEGMAVLPDGSLVVADTGYHVIRRYGPAGGVTPPPPPPPPDGPAAQAVASAAAGTWSVLAGTTATPGYSGDGGPALSARLSSPVALAVGTDGSVFVAERGNHVVRRIAPDGTLSTIAGTGEAGDTGDGGPATAAQLTDPSALAASADGALYVADRGAHRVRRIAPGGTISTVAGTGVAGFSGDGDLAALARLSAPTGLAVNRAGDLFVADAGNFRMRRVDASGRIQTIAGNGTAGYTGDGGPALSARVTPYKLALQADGSLAISDGLQRVRRVGTDGVIAAVAGTPNTCLDLVTGTCWGCAWGDGGPARSSWLCNPSDVAAGPEGDLYLLDAGSYVVRVVHPPVASFLTGDLVLPSPDGARLHRVSAEGRHLSTLHALTGEVVHAFGYDEGGRLAEVRDGEGNLLVRIERRPGGATLVAGGGQRTELAFGPGSTLESVVGPAGDAWAVEHGTTGLLTALTGPAGGTSRFEYTPDGRLARHEDAAGGATTLVRSGPALEREVTVSPSGGIPTVYATRVETVGVDVELHRTITPVGCPSATWLTDRSGATQLVEADGTTVEETLATDARFGWTTPALASRRVTTPAGLHTTAIFTESVTLGIPGDPLSMTASRRSFVVDGRSWRIDWDGAIRSLVTTTPQGRVMRRTLGAGGLITEHQLGDLASVVLTHEGPGRLVERRQGAGLDTRSMMFSWSPSGTLASVTDALGRTAYLEHDAAARPTAVTGPGGDTLRVVRDGHGAAVAVDTPLGARHRLVRDGRGLLAAYEPPAVAGEPGADRVSFTRDTERRLVRTDQPDGTSVAEARGCGGRLESRTTPEGVATFEYHPSTGRLARLTDPRGVVLDLAFDGPLLLEQRWSGPVAGRVTSTWEDGFSVARETVNGAFAVDFTRDGDGFPTRAGPLALVWDANGLLSTTAVGLVSTAATHDAFGDLATLEATAGATGLFSASHLRDPLGRLVRVDETVEGGARVWEYGYDVAGRLSSATLTVGGAAAGAWTYGYDLDGNRTSMAGPAGAVTAAFDVQDRLLAQGDETFTWARTGRLAGRSGASGPTVYAHDTTGSLVAVDLPGGRRIEYVVDAAGRRVGRRVDGVLVQGLLYRNGRQVAAELDGAGAVRGRFVYGSRAGVPDLVVRDGITYRLVTDHLGSVRLVVNATTGAVAQRIDYGPYGEVLLDTSPGFQPFGFAGGLHDPDTGLVRLGARDYDPSTGRFTTRDPILFGGGANLYAYAGGDPVNRSDGSGLCSGPCPEPDAPDPDDLLDRLREILERAEKLSGDPSDPLGDLRTLKGILDTLNDLNGELDLVDFGNVPVDFILQEIDAALDALEKGIEIVENHHEKLGSVTCGANQDGTTHGCGQ